MNKEPEDLEVLLEEIRREYQQRHMIKFLEENSKSKFPWVNTFMCLIVVIVGIVILIQAT